MEWTDEMEMNGMGWGVTGVETNLLENLFVKALRGNKVKNEYTYISKNIR